jgi:2-isopropylmalate synthase
MADGVRIFDTTLRDGEQSPGIALNADEKVQIAEQLARLRVDVVEAGFPASSPGDFEAVRKIAREVGHREDHAPVIAALARANPADIDRAWEAIRDAARARIHVFISTSPSHMEHMLKMEPEDVMAATKASVAWARECCQDVEFSPQDATRSDLEFMIAVCRLAVEEGATTINIPDTVGFATPGEYGALIDRVVREVKADREEVVISTHCHNDLGLAVANSLAAVEHGARQVEGAVNGIGERAGNTSIEEVVMALVVRSDQYGLEVGVDTAQIYPTSRLVAELTGYPIQYNKAVVGRNAFSHESGIHQHGVLRERATYEIMDPASVGQEGSKIVLGKHSGRYAFGNALEKLGYQLEEGTLQRSFERFKELADRKVEINERELQAIVEEESSVDEVVQLVSMHVAGGTKTTPQARVKVETAGGLTLEYEAEGDGMVDASFAALQQAFGVRAGLLDYQVRPLSGGADAMAEVSVVVRIDGRTYTGRGVSTDVVEGSARAFVAALNKAASEVLNDAVAGGR